MAFAEFSKSNPMAKTLLTFVEDIYEDLELWYPLLRLQEAGYSTRIAAPEIRTAHPRM